MHFKLLKQFGTPKHQLMYRLCYCWDVIVDVTAILMIQFLPCLCYCHCFFVAYLLYGFTMALPEGQMPLGC